MFKRTKWKKKAPIRTEYDWIKWASKEEMEVYQWIKDGSIFQMTWIEELDWAVMIDPRPKAFRLFDKFVAWKEKVMARRYTSDYIIKLKDWTEVVLEYKSKFTESKPDYRLRRSIFLFFYNDKVKFAELIKIKKWDYVFKRYY